MLQTAPHNPPLPRDLWLKRLHYRSWHRGCKETDILMGAYCDAYLATLSEEELTLYEAFLEEDDADIWKWLTEEMPCPHPSYAPLLAAMREMKQAK